MTPEKLRLKILFDHQVFSYQETGGVSRYFSELIHHLPIYGCQVSLGFRWTVNRYLLDQSEATPFLGRKMFKGKTRLLAAINRKQSVYSIEAGNFDLFHPTYYDPYFLKFLGHKPFVVTIHDMIHELYPESVSDASAVQKRKRLLAHRAQLVIAVSENTRQDAIRILGLPPEKVVTIYHGNALVPGQIRPAELDLPEQFILYLGSRATYKNVEIVWRAFARTAAKYPDLRLIHAGGGAFTIVEHGILRALGIEEKVLHYIVDDSGLAALYSAAICLAYPSRYEGFGLPLIEAMAWNCPVVAAQSSCLPEIGGDAAQYVDPNDEQGWTEALKTTVDSGARNDSVSTQRRLGRARKFRWEISAQETLNAYHAAIGVLNDT